MVASSRPILWSFDARADLSEIWDYYAKVAGPHTANRIVRSIHETCRLLEDHPFAGRGRNELRPGLRSIAAASNIIFYRVKDDVAEIVRVLDGRRDLDEVFAGESSSR